MIGCVHICICIHHAASLLTSFFMELGPLCKDSHAKKEERRESETKKGDRRENRDKTNREEEGTQASVGDCFSRFSFSSCFRLLIIVIV